MAVAAWWPADAQVTCEDGVLKTSIPAAQDGTVSPILLVGHTTGVVNSYEGVDMELSQLGCTMYIRLIQNSYKVTRAVIEANGGEMIGGEVSVRMTDWNVTASAPQVTVTRRSGRLRGRRSDARRAAGACGSFVGLHGDLVRWRYGG